MPHDQISHNVEDRAHRYGNREDKSFQPVTFSQSVNQEYKGNHDEHKTDQQNAHLADTFVKGCGGTMSGNVFGNCSEIGMVSGSQDDSCSRSADYI